MFAVMPGASADPAAPKPAIATAAPIDVTPLLAEGDKRAAGGDLYGAVESYAAARRAAPADRFAAGRLGIVLAEQGRHAEALPHLEDAEQTETPEPAVIRSLINALLALERPLEASLRLTRALAMAPDDARLWNAAGIAADLSGDVGAATAAYHKGLATAPDNLSLKTNLALSRYAAGDMAAASQAAEAAGLTMSEVEVRARRLVAYRDRARARLIAARPSPGNVPAPPPMVALALPPVQVSELPAARPVTAPPVAIAAADVASTAATEAPAKTIDAPVAAAAPAEAAAQPLSPPTAAETTAMPEAAAAAPPAEAAVNPPPAAAEPAPAAQQDAAPVLAAIPAAPEPPGAAPTTQMAAATPVTAAPAAPESAPAAPAEAPARWTQPGGNLVQLAAYGRASLAEAQWKKLKGEHAALLDGLEPVIQRADLGDRGVVYRLRIGVADRPAATSLCDRLRGAGIDCIAVPAS